VGTAPPACQNDASGGALKFHLPTLEAAQAHFGEFADTWGDTYPAMISSSEAAWSEFVPFLEFPVVLRKIVYRTDESLNATFRRAVAL
jgi:putative transposase